jgi:O-antigen ligase
MWRFVPFYIAVAAAPLLFGGIKPESQAALGLLLGVSLLLTGREGIADGGLRIADCGRNAAAGFGLPRWLKVALVFVFMAMLVPLPMAVVKVLSPERARLALEFPIGGVAPEWLTLSVSPARTIQRFWELALALAAFALSRRAAALPGANRRMAITLAFGLLLVAASDLWSRHSGRENVLGLWSISWGKGAGTFANRNHFANWIFMASFFGAGWSLRAVYRREHLRWVVLVAAAVVFGLTMAFLSASRGGTFAFVMGGAVLLFLLRKRFRNRGFALATSFAIVALIAAALISAEPLVRRLQHEGTSLNYKGGIWRQTLGLAAKFPATGIGAGSFVRAFDHYKAGDGDRTFWHAENDGVELVLEFGVLGSVVLLLALFKTISLKHDSPVTAAALAALTVFVCHSLVEFVSYMPANLILAAALFGFVSKGSDEAISPAPIWRAIPALAVLILAGLQMGAWQAHWSAYRAATPGEAIARIERSLALWPFAVERHVGLVRAEARNRPTAARVGEVDRRVEAALRMDPLNWNLRLEQAWFELAYGANPARALSNAWLTVRLNPLQGQIPLRFARHFAGRYPDVAMQFLAATDIGVAENHRQALGLAWEMSQESGQLWALTPNTVPAILNLIHFAQERKLHGIAAEACQALKGRIELERLAELFFEAKRPEEALRLLGDEMTLRAQKLRLTSLFELGRFEEAVKAARTLFAEHSLQPVLHEELRPDASFAKLLENHEKHPADPALALLLAEKAARMEPVDLKLLAGLAARFPDEARIVYLLFEAQAKGRDAKATAATGVELAGRLIR